MNRQHKKLIAILGPTAGGKTTWSLELAKKYNGEIINCDSRQIYKWMNVGTAKEPGKWKSLGKRRAYIVEDIPHYLIDFLTPDVDFSVAEFQRRAIRRIKEIQRRGKMPFLVGGTGLYIKAVVDNMKIPQVKANQNLRDSLETKDNEELWNLLGRMDPVALKVVDPQNKRRIIRALEVCILTGKPFSEQRGMGEPIFETLQLGIRVPREELHARIDRRVEHMLERGLIDEVKLLRRKGYEWDAPGMSGIGYKEIGNYIRGQMDLQEATELLRRNTHRYSRRQETWFKRDHRINWINDRKRAHNIISEFVDR